MISADITVETQIPSDIYLTLKAQGVQRKQLAEESRRLLAVHFFSEHLLSLGQAVRLSGMDYWSFTEFLSINHVPIVNFDEEELSDELSTVRWLGQQLQDVKE